MNNSTALVQTVVVTLLLATAIAPAHGQTAAPDPLFKTIQSLDTQLFDAYNHCDLDKFGSFLADDLEFYHDKTGLSRGRPALVGGIKNNICGKVTRELVPGTLEVYPIANYGAVETGIHRFHHPGHENPVRSARPSSSTSGKTRTECGRSLGSSASTTSP